MADRDKHHPPDSSFDLAGEESGERAGELSRLISLSDGVFAFAMTLLVVSIDVPILSHDEASTKLIPEIRALWPQIISYVIGFLVIGSLWGSHRRLYSRICDYDETLTKLNIILLMMVAFLPFPTAVLGQYGSLAFPSIFYSLIISCISLLFILTLDHLDRHRELLTRNGAGFDFPRSKARHLVTALIFLLTIPISWFLPGAGQLAWFLLAFNHQITERILPYLPGRFGERGGQS